MICPQCNLPRYYGPTGIAAPQCQCVLGYHGPKLAPAPEAPKCPHEGQCHPGFCPCSEAKAAPQAAGQEQDERAAFESAMLAVAGFTTAEEIAAKQGACYLYHHLGYAEIGWQAAMSHARAALAQHPNLADKAVQKRLAVQWGYALAQQAEANQSGGSNGRHDGLRSTLHGCVSVGSYTPGALADLLFASNEVMALNAQLGLTMDQIVPFAQAVLAAAGAALAQRQPLTEVARMRIGQWLNNEMNAAVRNGANSVSMPDELVEIAAWLAQATAGEQR